MDHKIRNLLAVAFAFAVLVFTVLALLSIWEFLPDDIIWKSLSTLVVLVIASAIIFGIIKILDYQTPGRKDLPPPEKEDSE